MRTVILFFILLINFSTLFAQSNRPEVTNVTFSQRNDGSFIVDVYYDLNDADGDTMSVLMQVSDDAGSSWNFSCDSIAGDIGCNILSGSSKHIVWYFGAEHPQTFGDQFRVKIIADESNFEKGTVTDIDGNIYITVKIGDQWWMAENLKVIHYRNGDTIPNVTSGSEWAGLSTGGYCNYDNDSVNVATYGRLYNWFAVEDSRNIAPTGWHVPSAVEWLTLADYIGGGDVAGGKLKETDTTHWASPNEAATNECGFTALPAGYRNYSGNFFHLGNRSYWWSSNSYFNPIFNTNNALIRYILYNYSTFIAYNERQEYGYSIRCIKDN
jgi:uncharacterized protein (TIGR02145 family)